ncbi:MAG: metallophosphoesterase [Deltaproteobacteria bacterium]|nr:metallophosphoesterase [Deltaproteobacteria bacterium]
MFNGISLPGKRSIRDKFAVRQFVGPELYRDTLDHVRVVHLTDMHVGRVTPMEAQFAAVDIANAAKPDFVAITGDFVCHSQKFLHELTAVIEKIDAPVFAVLGNHDYWSGADEVRAALRKANALVLDNMVTTITVRGQKLQILGLDDAYTGHADRARAVKNLDRSLPTLGLSHIAEEADALWEHDVHLVLSGHTHAGQITIAKLHEIAIGKVAGHKYVHGLYGSRDRATPGGSVYVGAGVGAAVMPLRIGDRAKREVTVFELGQRAFVDAEHHDEQPAFEGRKPTEELKAKRHEKVQQLQAKRDAKSK